MKRKTISISKKLMAGFLAAAVIVTGVVILPETAKAADAVSWDSTIKMSDYWTTAEKKAPVKEGYVFSGWYKNETTPLKETDLAAADDTAIAKFVPAAVLSIKTQVGTDGETTSMRILSTVDSTNYQAVGFNYKLATQEEGTAQFTKVYSKIKQSKSSDTVYEPNIFSEASQHFIAADVRSISSRSFDKIVYARPFWVTMDGTKVMGLARNSRVEDKDTDKDYTSVGINLLPQLTTEKQLAQVAAGKIQVTYNTDDYDVVAADIAVDATKGGKYLFPEMECYVNEAAGTITFVGNADDVTADLTADGLFANVRFKQTTSEADAQVDLTIETTEFCNWAEASVKNLVVQ